MFFLPQNGKDKGSVMKKKVLAMPNGVTPNRPVIFDRGKCSGCNACVEVCPMDLLISHPEEGNPPVVLFPDECWYCGSCVLHCLKGAITLNLPLVQRVRWKRKKTGEHFRV